MSYPDTLELLELCRMLSRRPLIRGDVRLTETQVRSFDRIRARHARRVLKRAA